MSGPVRYRCRACDCHTLTANDLHEACALCGWARGNSAELTQARTNVTQYGVALDPSHPHFAVVRHPILGPRGETAIDRVLLRERAYIEFRTRLKDAGEAAELPERLVDLLGAVVAADKLYVKTTLRA